MNNYEFYSLGHMTELYNILNWKRVQDKSFFLFLAGAMHEFPLVTTCSKIIKIKKHFSPNCKSRAFIFTNYKVQPERNFSTSSALITFSIKCCPF